MTSLPKSVCKPTAMQVWANRFSFSYLVGIAQIIAAVQAYKKSVRHIVSTQSIEAVYTMNCFFKYKMLLMVFPPSD
jgi:hypothetical protein